jgi:hypothetical protein
MYAEHRWTIKDLLLHMVIEDTHIPYTASKEKRARDISKAIFEQPQVASAIYKASTGLRDLQIDLLVRSFQEELHRSHTIPGFGAFDPDKDPYDLGIPHLIGEAKIALPGLWRFLETIVGSQPTSDQSPRRLDGALLMICEILAHSDSSRKSNAFHLLMGIYLHSMGVKRRVINTLAGLGVGVSYETVRRHLRDIADIAAVSLGFQTRLHAAKLRR